VDDRDRQDDASREREPGGGYVIGPTSGAPDVEMTPRSEAARATRSDDWIRGQIVGRIQASSLAGAAIDVEVKNGDVHLRGSVTGPAAKHLVEQIAESIGGIRSVRSDLEIEGRGADPAR
jgi:osmotically-inducible protein OsmY